MSERTKRPSPALVVAIAALIVALAGTAVATPIAIRSLNKKEKKVVKKIAANKANQAIDQRAPGLSVASANTASSAASANTASSAANATALEGSRLAEVAPGAITFLPSCSPGSSFTPCGSFELTLNRAADVMIIATAQWYSPDTGAVRGRCLVRRLDVGMSSPTIELGSTDDDTDSARPRSVAFAHRFSDVPAGTTRFELQCDEQQQSIELEGNRMVGFVVT